MMESATLRHATSNRNGSGVWIIVLLLCGLGCFAHAEEWETAMHQDGIEIATRTVADSPIRAFRAEATVAAAPEAVLALMLDAESYPDWVESCREARVLEQPDALNVVTYQVNGMPLFVADRDLVLAMQVEEAAEGGFVLHFRNRPEELPTTDRVRIPRAVGHYALQPDGLERTRIVWEQHTEPGGELPAWLVNQLLIDIPFKTLSKLRARLETPASPYRTLALTRDSAGHPIGWGRI